MNSEPHDLQLEDVEDYSSDYPPVGSKQSEENIAAVGIAVDDTKGRKSSWVSMIQANKVTLSLVFVIVVFAITLFAIVGQKDSSSAGSATSTQFYADPIIVDPDSLDDTVVDELMVSLKALYSRHGLDDSPLDEDDSPQRKAFHWMATDSITDEIGHTQFTQRYAMAVLYYATNAVANDDESNPDPWVSAHLWLSDHKVCKWYGIDCNDEDHIVAIELPENNLSGSLPSELLIIASTLKTMDLTSNYICLSGSDFDVFTSLTRLETLMLEDNYLHYHEGVPSQFANLVDLRKLVLSLNDLSGKLEDEHIVLAKMTKLTHLEMEATSFSGTMPAAVGELSSLVYLYMRDNNMEFNLNFLKGGKMTDLFALWLDKNDVTGTIPSELQYLTDMASLSLTSSALTGTIPKQLAELSGLRRLWLYSNELVGTVPAEFDNLTELEVLQLHDNNLSGSMPNGLCTIIDDASYEYKSLTSDCVALVDCALETCCTECY
eukprot:Nitzschia sp. Nitz4//scaffold322_size40381//8691//10223//NITZ4_007554-RA/size40381-augustus-gene-0.55-mRNA-1//-1//CDS//3329547809//8510//frame0